MIMNVPLTRYFDYSLKLTGSHGLYSAQAAYDGVYEFFAGRPCYVQFNNAVYNVSEPVAAVQMPKDVIATDQNLRLCALHAENTDNVNDGLYSEAKDGPPAHLVLDGHLFNVKPVPPG